MALSVDPPYTALTKTNGKAFPITLRGAKGPIKVTAAETKAAAALDFAIGPWNPDGTDTFTFTIFLEVKADVSVPCVYGYNILDSTGSSLSAHVLVLPETSSTDLLVFFYGADGFMYLLSQQRVPGAEPIVTPLPGYPGPEQPTPISMHKRDADKHSPYLIPPLSGAEAAYVTCYLLDLQTLKPDVP